MPHVPDAQAAVAFGIEQTVAHVPQLLGSLLVLASQPLAVTLSQLAKPALQLAIPHVLNAQLAVEFGNEHTVPQPPQLVTLFVMLISQPSADKPLQSRVPAGHELSTQLPAVQTKPATQTVGQAPQWLLSELRLTSHPFAATPSQLA